MQIALVDVAESSIKESEKAEESAMNRNPGEECTMQEEEQRSSALNSLANTETREFI